MSDKKVTDAFVHIKDNNDEDRQNLLNKLHDVTEQVRVELPGWLIQEIRMSGKPIAVIPTPWSFCGYPPGTPKFVTQERQTDSLLLDRCGMLTLVWWRILLKDLVESIPYKDTGVRLPYIQLQKPNAWLVTVRMGIRLVPMVIDTQEDIRKNSTND